MKTPTHIYIFEKDLSPEKFELLNKRTKNKDFQKIKKRDYPTLFSLLEIMCDEYWGGEFEHVYATYLNDDFITLQLSSIGSRYILAYNDKLKSIFEEAYELYTSNKQMEDVVSNAAAIIDEYSDIKIENFDYKREISSEYFSGIFEVLSEEKENILQSLDDQLDELKLG